MPLACLPVQIAGRNRLWREMVIDAIENDPAWNGGEYKTQPLRRPAHRGRYPDHRGHAPLQMQKACPTRERSIRT